MPKNVSLITVALALVLCGAGRAVASTLYFDLEDPAAQSDTPYHLSFTAGAPSTDIAFAGYQVPAYERATDISLTSGGGNLLGQTWTLTHAASGSDAAEYDDGLGTGTYALFFAGSTEDSFDQYDQIVTTVIGQTYDLNFLFSNSSANAPSELVVSTSNASTPEPASVVLLGLGLGACFLTRKRFAR